MQCIVLDLCGEDVCAGGGGHTGDGPCKKSSYPPACPHNPSEARKGTASVTGTRCSYSSVLSSTWKATSSFAIGSFPGSTQDHTPERVPSRAACASRSLWTRYPGRYLNTNSSSYFLKLTH